MIVMIIFSLWVFPALAWIAGFIHMRFVSDHGQLDKEDLSHRRNLYAGTLVAAWAVFVVFKDSLLAAVPDLMGWLILILLGTGIVLFCLFVVAFSYLEVFWYQRVLVNPDSIRGKIFYWGILGFIGSSSAWRDFIFLIF